VRLSDFLRTWEGHEETENRFSRIIILGLLVVCVITSLAAWRTRTRHHSGAADPHEGSRSHPNRCIQ
jgi:hypothetical protein